VGPERRCSDGLTMSELDDSATWCPALGGGFGCVSTPFAEVRIIESAFDGDDVSYDELMIVH
jgi:hypothetical protein